MLIDNISNVFQSKLRLSIIAALMTGEKNFNKLKEITNATDGNLSVQLKKLKNDNFVIERKELKNKREYTVYSITKTGKNKFVEYVETLQEILEKSEY